VPLPSAHGWALNGLPAASRLELSASRAVAAVACAWFALVAAWELFGPVLAGHYASSASMGIIAENMLRWRIPGPVWEYTASRPSPEMYYCHHPWGIFWTTAAFMKVFGRHDFVCRLPAVLLSAATPALLYALGRSAYRPAAGAAAAASFVVLPITLSFANFNALEVPVIAWTLLGVWGYVRMLQTSRRRYLAVSVLGLGLGMHADWPAFVLVGGLLAFGALRAFFLRPATFGPVRPRRYAQWWVLTACAAALTLALYVAMFHKADKLVDLLQSYAMRSSGNQAPLAQVLASRRYWIELMFTPLALGLGAVGAAACLGRLAGLTRLARLTRLASTRNEHDALPLLFLVMATVQYVVFRQGADIHIFWPHYFAVVIALSAAALVDMGAGLAARAARRPHRAGGPAVVALAVMLAPLALVLRDGVPALRYARETGGRFNEKGLLIDSDGDKTAFLRWLAARLPADAPVGLHEGMKPTWAQTWALGGRVVAHGRPLPKAPLPGAYLVDTRFLPDAAQEDLARRYRVLAAGPYWAIGAGVEALAGEAGAGEAGEAGAGAGAGIHALSFQEREPSPLAWYFISGTEPRRDLVADPFLAWELRAHFGQPATPPTARPETLEQKRVAHNAALAAGDAAGAAALLAEIQAALAPVSERFEDGTEILGAAFQPGARSLLTIVVRAGGPMQPGVTLAVRSKVVERAPLSTTMADPVEREVGLPAAIAPERWRPGFLYADPVPIRKRPGTEVFAASLRGRGAPRRLDKGGGSGAVEVLRLR